MSRSKNRKIADLISGGTLDDGVVAASEVTGLHSIAVSGNFNELSNKPTPFDPSTLATVATTGAYSSLSGKPSIPSAGSVPQASSDPAGGDDGSMYYNTAQHQLYVRKESSWTPLIPTPPEATAGTAALTASSLVSFSHDLSTDFTQQGSGVLLYSLVDGTLPTGLSLPTSGNSLAFTPAYSATSASYVFRVKATDEAGLASSPKSYTFSVAAAPVYGLFNLGSTSFPSGTVSATSGGYNFRRYLGSANFNAAIANGVGIGEAFVLLWGAGGRKHTASTSGEAGFGGWGLAKVTSLQITNSSVRIETGGTGGTTTTATPASGGSIGGGASGGPYTGSGLGYDRGAGGGGLTAMFSSTSRTHSQTVLAVGSGGGQSTDGNGKGGNGGGFNQDGQSPSIDSGRFGTLSAGGAGAGQGTNYRGVGGDGSALTGGTGATSNYDGGNGGGAGYFGGGGGKGGGGYSGGGGGGGSGYAASGITVLSTGTLAISSSANRATLEAAITSAIGVSYSLPNLGGNSADGGFVIIQIT